MRGRDENRYALQLTNGSAKWANSIVLQDYRRLRISSQNHGSIQIVGLLPVLYFTAHYRQKIYKKDDFIICLLNNRYSKVHLIIA